MTDLTRLPISTPDNWAVHVVVETPKGYRVKLKFDEELQAMALHRPLPPGQAYPFDWGFIPSTLADDGDPLDAFILGDVQTAPGVVVPCRIIGVLVLLQLQGPRSQRNDRLVAVPAALRGDAVPEDATNLPQKFRNETEAFFQAIKRDDLELKFLGWHGPERALELLRDCGKRFSETQRLGFSNRD